MFTSHYGLSRLNRKPGGLKNAPWTVQRAMHVHLNKFKTQPAFVDLEIFVIYSRMPDEHVNHARQVLLLLQDAGVKLKLKMRTFTNRID